MNIKTVFYMTGILLSVLFPGFCDFWIMCLNVSRATPLSLRNYNVVQGPMIF